MGLSLYTGGETPSKPLQVIEAVLPRQVLIRLPILGNPNGCIYEKLSISERGLVIAALSRLLNCYGEIIPKSGFADIWEIEDGNTKTHAEKPDYQIKFSQGEAGVRNFTRVRSQD